MLKVISGKIIDISSETEKIKFVSKFPTLVLVINGSAFINRELTNGGCFIPRSVNTYIKSERGGSCTAAIFELDGKDTENLAEKHGLADLSHTVKFTVKSPEHLEKFARLICSGDILTQNTELCEASVKLLFSLTSVDEDKGGAAIYGNKYVDGAIKYIDANLSGELKVESIAYMLGVDRMYLRNLFFRHVGVSTMEYIMNARINCAKQLLENESLNVSQIAAAVGYSDVLAFSKAFKKHVGVSPTQFRKGTAEEAPPPKPKKEDIPIFIL